MHLPRVSRWRLPAAVLTVAAIGLMSAGVASAWSGGVSNVSGAHGANGWYTSDVTVSYDFHAVGLVEAGSTYSEFLNTVDCGASNGTDSTGFSAGDPSIGRTSLGGSLSLTAEGVWDTGCSGQGTFRSYSSSGCGFFGAFPCVGSPVGFGFGATFDGIQIDKTAPTGVTIHGQPAANAFGWYNSPFTMTIGGTDPVSLVVGCGWGDGYGSSPVTGPSLTVNTNTTSFGAGAAGGCQNGAGLRAFTGTNWKYDATKPTIAAAATTSSNGNGWYNGNVVVHSTCVDVLSGILSCPTDQTLSSEGAAVDSVAQTATDKAGNTSDPSNVVEVSIDKTAPVVSVTGATDGSSYLPGSAPTPGCSTSDSLSGVATNATLNVTGGPLGSITATCSGAQDNAGNSGSSAATYSVIYSFSGFLQPVDSLPICNITKAGSSIPVKFRLSGYQGMNIFAAGSPSVAAGSCAGSVDDTIEQTVTSGASGLQYDAASDTYTYVWKTDKTWAGQAKTLTLALADSKTYHANFSFTK